jgi:hypothetical protein
MQSATFMRTLGSLDRRWVVGGLLLSSLAVLAATRWPFVAASVASYAGTTFQADMESNFTVAATLPRLIMLTSVTSIKKGDIVRIIYPDGRVVDFETAARCTYALSRACEFTRHTEVSGPDAPTTPSQFQTDLARDRASCRGGAAGAYTSATIPVHLWTTTHSWNDAAQIFNTTGTVSVHWITVTFQIPGRPSCH